MRPAAGRGPRRYDAQASQEQRLDRARTWRACARPTPRSSAQPPPAPDQSHAASRSARAAPTEVRLVHPGHRPGSLNQHRSQPLVAMPLARRRPPTGRLVDPRRNTSPLRQMRSAGAPGHVRTGLHDDDLNDLLPPPGIVCSRSISCRQGSHFAAITASCSTSDCSTRSSRPRIARTICAWCSSSCPSSA